jgi:hypothetical protein
MKEIMVSKCCVPSCRKHIGCYVSDRTPKDLVCKDGCTGPCPTSTDLDSHGLCGFHLQKALNEHREERHATENSART